LAERVGVTRQWVIDIEKGKPRAELGLALKALQVLGLMLRTDSKGGGMRTLIPTQPETASPAINLDQIVQDSRSAAARWTAGPRTLKSLRELAKPGKLTTAADSLRALQSAGKLAEAASPAKLTAAADRLRVLQPISKLLAEPMTGRASNSSAPRPGKSAAKNRLAKKKKPTQ